MFEQMADSIWVAMARLAGVSPDGQATLIELQRKDAEAVWCVERSESDVARERLLAALAEKEVDETAVAAAKQAEIAAVAQDKAASLDRLILTMRELSAEDRQKFATWLFNDLRDSWRKRSGGDGAR